jgi:hypothetical protein
MTLEEGKILEEIQHRNECWRQTNQATIDTGAKALGALFLLNGSAATALLAQSGPALRYVALVFAFAALWAIVTGGVTYLFSLVIAETWRLPPPENPDDPWIPLIPWKRTLSLNDIARWRIRLVAFASVPAMLFLAGLVLTGITI